MFVLHYSFRLENNSSEWALKSGHPSSLITTVHRVVFQTPLPLHFLHGLYPSPVIEYFLGPLELSSCFVVEVCVWEFSDPRHGRTGPLQPVSCAAHLSARPAGNDCSYRPFQTGDLPLARSWQGSLCSPS